MKVDHSLKRAALIIAFFLKAALAMGATKQPPDLYFYPPPFEHSNGEVFASPVTMDVRQITVLFPQIKEMAGVVLLVNWSDLCPTVSACDYGVIDQTLLYWAGQRKKVILGVVSVGHPMQLPRAEGKDEIRSSTPTWVLDNVDTYVQEAPLIAPVRPITTQRSIPTVLPSYWDERFLLAKRRLVFHLANRYDGRPEISKVRIDTGILTEDNPSFDGLRNEMPGWSNIKWIKYCDKMIDMYREAFQHTQLEFDIDRIGWIYALGSATDRAAADALLEKVNRLNIFLAMDGFDSDNVAQWRHKENSGVAQSLNYIVERRKRGFGVGLEGAPMFNPKLQDIKYLADAFQEIGASRMVLFSDFPALLNLDRNGPNKENQSWRRLLATDQQQVMLMHVKQLLDRFRQGATR